MPSLNYTTELSRTRRIRVNVCEGEVHVTEEVLRDRGRWLSVNASIKLTRQQADELAHTITAALQGGF